MNATDIYAFLLKSQNILSMLTFMRLTAYMWPLPAVVQDGASYDFIIVGGGTTGCVIASRLVKMNVSVLLVEAGGEPPLDTVLPGLFPLLVNTQLDWNFTTHSDSEAFKYQRGHVLNIQQGKVLGGSGQINFLIYAQGIPADYDKWAEITKDPSWKYKNLSKYIKKLERVLDKNILNSPEVMYHGTKGKIKIVKSDAKPNKNFFRSYNELGQKQVLDFNAKNTLGYTTGFINAYSGFRQSTAYSYLRLEKKNPKLSVMYNALATKILFDENKRAVGVEIINEKSETITVKATKEVIVTAGTIKSPQLLMLSGIGQRAQLEKKKIKVISDLPVGQNYQDRQCTLLLYKMGKSKPADAPNPFEFPVDITLGNVAVMKNQTRPDYQIISGIVQPDFFIQACVIIYGFSLDYCDVYAKDVANRELYIVNHCLVYPKFRGEVLLNSTNPKQKPIIVPRYQTNAVDLDLHAQYIKHYNRVLNTTYYKSVKAEVIYPNLTDCKTLPKASLKYWRCYVKTVPTVIHMHFGTCAMGSVVNSNLQVIGTKKLRVGDASVMPHSVGAPIFASTIIVAERLVDILRKSHKLSYSTLNT